MKKILSILLSAILAVSVLGISASARTLGDVDSDKKANAADALKILQYTVGVLDTIDESLADVNCDGTVNSADALIVLRICVGAYEGPTEVDLKPEVIDPIMKTGKFTLTTIVDAVDKSGNSYSIPTTFMFNGKNKCISMVITISGKSLNARIIFLNEKIYMAFPEMYIYTEITKEDLNGMDFSNMTYDEESTYVGSFYSTYNEKTYTVDSYRADDGSVTDFYFLDGKWVMMGNHSAKPEEAQKITEFKAGVDESYFSLKGLIKVDADKLFK